MRRRELVLCLLLITGITALSAQNEVWYLNKPIANITFEGLDRIKVADLEGVIRPFIGLELNQENFDNLQRRLYEMDEFEYLEVSFKEFEGSQDKVWLVVQVTERPGLEDILFEGNTSVRSMDLMDEIILRTGKTYSQPLIDADVLALKNYYLSNGFADVQVSSRIDDGSKESRKKLVFIINEGYKVSVKKISFLGINTDFTSEATLKGQMKTAEQSLFNVGLYQASVLESDKANILKYYQENGYVDAKILDIVTSYERSDKDRRNYMTISISIDEGNKWTYAGLSLKGNLIFSTEELMALTKLRAGSVFNVTQFKADYQAIADKYYKNGYINNAIRLSEERNQEDATIACTISITEFGRAYVENIIIKGNEKTKDEVILRELPVEEGDVFSLSNIILGQQNLYSKQYFSQIVPETPSGSAQGLYDLVINLEEQNTTNISGGIALSGADEFPLSLVFSWADTNFLGNGQNFSIDTTVSWDTQKIAASFSDPWLFGNRWGGGVTLSVEHGHETDVAQDLLYPVFDEDEDEYAVPDPYTGAYVFSEDTEYNGVSYSAGDYFPGIPTISDISQYDLVTDYVYAGGSSGIPDEYTMEYYYWNVSLALTTSYKIRTKLGWLVTGASASSSLIWINYDASLYRPYDYEIRENNGTAQIANRIGLSLALDNRDISYDPSTGYYLSESLSFTGGLLGGSRHYIRTDTTVQGYLTLWDIPVSENNNFKTILALNSTLSVLLPQFFVYGDGDTFVATSYYLYTNPSFIARGWDARTDGEGLMNNWVELRTPIVKNVLSFDMFFEGVRFVENREDLFAANGDWMFGFGAGLRLTMPQFPLRIYVGKRFSVDGASGEMTWEQGNLGYSSDDSVDGVDIMITFSFN